MTLLERIQGPHDLKPLSHEELQEVAQDCRNMIVETITKRGGHLASNLGVVELTLALHRAFESPRDRLVFDTSNQVYTHKLVTGRRDRFPTVRTPGGLSGFAEPSESPHDTLAAGHAGTGLSYALGMSIALQHDTDEPYVVAIVGDGALTSGPSYEALNNIVHVRPKRLIVILNDNGWSISENVGWLVHWRNRIVLDPRYHRLTEVGQRILAKLPHGGDAWALARKIKTSVEGVFLPSQIWEELGLHYVGPVDGHDFRELESALQAVKDVSRDGTPAMLHVLTHKGRGYELAEANPSKFHQPGTPSPSAGSQERLTYSQVFARTLITLMENDPRVVAISAAMLEGTALTEVKKRFPDRVFDVGIAEEHAVIMAGGMAKAGLRPFVAIYSTFLQRSFDQIIHDVCLQNLPVTLCIDRAGLVGDDGKTHQGIFDISYTRCVPNLIVSAPKDENELQHLLNTALHSDRPFAIRYPRGLGLGVVLDESLQTIPIGKAELVREGKDVCLLAYGYMVGIAQQAAEVLSEQGIECAVVNARYAKPVDHSLLAALAIPRILTLEEHLRAGGFGSGVLETLAPEGSWAPEVRLHAIPDQFIEHGPQASQRSLLRLDVPGVVSAVLEAFPSMDSKGAVRGAEKPSGETGASERITW
jgi:1-deoxy-D-xylulose-5-phosphate synthase